MATQRGTASQKSKAGANSAASEAEGIANSLMRQMMQFQQLPDPEINVKQPKNGADIFAASIADAVKTGSLSKEQGQELEALAPEIKNLSQSQQEYLLNSLLNGGAK